MNDAELAKNYILGRLPEEERVECEQRFLFDPGFEDLVLERERELFDDYVNLRLPEEEAAAVQREVVQQSGRLYRLRFAKSLRRASMAAANRSSRPSPLRRWRSLLARRQIIVFGGLTITAALAIAMFVAVATRSHRHPLSLPAQSAANALRQPAHASAPTSPAPSGAADGSTATGRQSVRPAQGSPATAATATFLLLADQQRGAIEETSIALKRGVTTLRLQLTTQEGLDPGHYSATLADAQGAQTFSAYHLAPREEGGRRYVEIGVPAAKLPGGGYSVTLLNENASSQPLTFRFALAASPSAENPPQ